MFREISNRTRSFLLVVAMMCMSLIVTACAQGPRSKSNHVSEEKLQVTATTGMIADIARQVGGDFVNVIGLMGPGVDAHLYKASQGDISKLEHAKVILYNGLDLEGKMSNIWEKMKKNKIVTAVSKDIPVTRLRSEQLAGKTNYDPHIWLDVKLWMMAVQTIKDTFIQADPQHAYAYTKHTNAYIQKLEQLDEEVRAKICTISEKARILVTTHDAFGYYGQAYALPVVCLQGFTTAAEYGAKDVSKLRDYLVNHNIKSVFLESSISSKAMNAIIAGAKEKGHVVTIGGQLFSDAMGEPGTEAGTYIGMVRHNTNTIVKALK